MASERDVASSGWRQATYLRSRALEGRLYSDAIVAGLPRMPSEHPLAREWREREDSSNRLVAYLRHLPRPLSVLDIGCGNGWLANRIASIDGSRVVAVDPNEVELAQAERVFGGRPNLSFVLADAVSAPVPPEPPDVIVLASVVQYLPDLREMIGMLRGRLAPGGELHVLDSPFYRTEEVDAARERSRRHYARQGVPEMAEMYRHHDWGTLAAFASEVLYRPDSMSARIARLFGQTRSSFPWIRIRAGEAR